MRQELHEYFVLPEFVWEEWAQEKGGLETYWEGLQDGLYPGLARKYLKKAIQMNKQGSLSPRQLDIVFERVLSRFSHHFDHGHKYF